MALVYVKYIVIDRHKALMTWTGETPKPSFE